MVLWSISSVRSGSKVAIVGKAWWIDSQGRQALNTPTQFDTVEKSEPIIQTYMEFSLPERENGILKQEIQQLRAENQALRQRIAQLESEHFERLREKVIQESGFASIDDMIVEHMQDPEFEQAWQEQQRQRKQELKQRLDQGKISKIKYYRLLKKMDQVTLAERTGMKQPNISRCEQVGYRLSLETLERIAQALGINVQELL